MLRFLLCFLLLASATKPLAAQVSLERVYPNLTFNNPVEAQWPHDGSGRLFVVEQAGKIRVFDSRDSLPTAQTFLDIRNRVNSGGEKGLLGLAFHPNFTENGYFFLNYTATKNNQLESRIARFRVDPADSNRADPASEQIFLRYDQPFGNHNAGTIHFGPDGYLYIPTGDGGSGGDPQNNAQDLSSLLGKFLRINVDSAGQGIPYSIPEGNPFRNNNQGYRPEIYAWGLRNPWKFSFDRQTGMLWAGDVGQGLIEEVDTIVAGGNYGWRAKEGTQCFNPSNNCDTGTFIPPAWQYSHDTGGRSITGGYRYRGALVPEIRDDYLYADYISKKVWALSLTEDSIEGNRRLLTAPGLVSSFAEAPNGELYLLGYANDGKIYRFRSAQRPRFSLQPLPQSNFCPSDTLHLTLDLEGDFPELSAFQVVFEDSSGQLLANSTLQPGPTLEVPLDILPDTGQVVARVTHFFPQIGAASVPLRVGQKAWRTSGLRASPSGDSLQVDYQGAGSLVWHRQTQGGTQTDTAGPQIPLEEGGIYWVELLEDNCRLVSEKKSFSVTALPSAEAQDGFRLFPNPTQGRFTVESPHPAEQRVVEVYASQGQRVLRKSGQAAKMRLNLIGHPQGLYLVKIRERGQVYWLKLEKE